MLTLLAVETATDACSVAVCLDGRIFEEFAVIPRQHTRQIFLMMDKLLANVGIVPAQIDALAFGQGPGSFTGLRVAASIVQGIAAALRRPVIPVSTLNALAQGVYRKFRKEQVFSCLDARMGEVYGGFYQFSPVTQQMAAFSAEFVANPSTVSFPEKVRWFGAGNGCKAYLSVLEQKIGFLEEPKLFEFYPSAYDVATLAITRFQRGEFVSPEQALPVYLRDTVCS